MVNVSGYQCGDPMSPGRYLQCNLASTSLVTMSCRSALTSLLTDLSCRHPGDMLASASMATGCSSRIHKPLLSSSQPHRTSLPGISQTPSLSGTQPLLRCQPLARWKSSVRCCSSLSQPASQLFRSQIGQGSSLSKAQNSQRSRTLCRARQKGREEPLEVEYINPPPGEGNLESTRLPDKLRQQVCLSHKVPMSF